MNREKIINAIEKAKKQSEEYAQDRIIVPFKEADMILALLKEPEAVEPEVDYICGNIVNICGKCKSNLIARVKFCPWCGRSVKWE